MAPRTPRRDQPEPGEHGAAHRQPSTGRGGQRVHGDAEDRHGEGIGERLRGPEADVVPQLLAAAERRAAVAVVDEAEDQRAEHHRQADDDDQGADERGEAERRDATHVHPRGARGEHRRDQRDRRGEQAEDDDHVGHEEPFDHPAVAATGTAVRGDGDDHQDDPGDPQPESGRRETRERKGASAELQRHHGECQAEDHRHHDRVDQAEAEHGEQLRHDVVAEERAGRRHPVEAEEHAHRRHPDRREEAATDEHPADALVIRGGDPADEPAQRARRRRRADHSGIAGWCGRAGGVGVDRGHRREDSSRWVGA